MPKRNFYCILITFIISLFIAAKTSVRDQLVRSVAKLVQKDSLVAPTEKKIFEGALAGLLDSVGDKPYTVYLPPNEQPEYMREIQGQYAGIGLSMFVKDKESGEFYFVPERDAPAAQAGLRFGDRIVEVDGQSASKMSLLELMEAIRGKEKTSVKLKIRPRAIVLDNVTESSETMAGLSEVLIERSVIQQDVVLGDRFDDAGNWIFSLKDEPDVGYVAVEQFVESTGLQTVEAFDSLEKEGITKVILDFRGNPGGFLPDAIAICNELLDKGSPIVETRRNDGSARLVKATKGKPRRFKVAVLIDGDSASASEIVSAALQDAGVAVVVGSRSYGKGTVQSILELPFNSGVARMTTASFWRPSGRPINRSRDAKPGDEWGVAPNEGFEVPVSPLQRFYSKWIRRIRVSTKETETVDANALALMTRQMNEIESELTKGQPSEKTEKAMEIGLPFDELFSAQNTPNTSLGRDQASAPENDNSSETEVHPFVPSGRAPYFDPQLDRAIEYLRSPENVSQTGDE